MQNFKGAIFDMDGTLLDSMPVWKRLTQRYLAQFDVHITDADYAVCEGFSQPQVAEYFLKRYPNLPLTQQQMLDGMDEMITSRYETIARPKDGVIDFLEGLRARGIKMAIVSNKIDFAVKSLDKLYFKDYMTAAIGEMEEEGIRKKPAPDMVQKALKELGVTQDEAIYVGDSDVDIATAKNSGLECVSVTWGFRDVEFLKEHGATNLIDEPVELLNYV